MNKERLALQQAERIRNEQAAKESLELQDRL